MRADGRFGVVPPPLQAPAVVAMSAAAAAVSSLPMTVLSADEAQRLRELLGEGRQLGSAMREILDGAGLLGGRGGHGLRLLARRLGPPARLPAGLGGLFGPFGR